MADEYKKTFKIAWEWSKDSLVKMSEDLDRAITKGVKSSVSWFKNQFIGAFKDAFSNSIEEMKSMLEYSQLSSSRTRELAFGYGFSSSQAYGFTQALKAVGLENEENLLYAKTQELAQFRKAFEKYSNYYENLYNSGFFEIMQDYQFEMQDFKMELTQEVIQFFINNKDLIKDGMKGLLEISKTLLQLFSWLVSAFGNANQALETSEILSQYSNVTNNSRTVSINNNFNGVGKNDERWLADMGNLTYAQVIEALGGGA